MTLLAAWVDGRAAAGVDVADRAVHFGDGVFETIAALGGIPQRLDAHLARLVRGVAALSIAPPEFAELAGEIRRAAAMAPACIVKVIVSRGQALERGYAYRGDERATRIVFAYAWPEAGGERAPARVAASAVVAAEQPRLAGVKHLNRLENVLARREARDRGLDEVVLCRADGIVAGGSMTNVFLLRAGRIETPRVDRCGVAGVVRGAVLAAATRLGMSAHETEIPGVSLDEAEEMFLTNALIGIWPVARFGNRDLGTPSIAPRLLAELAAGEIGISRDA